MYTGKSVFTQADDNIAKIDIKFVSRFHKKTPKIWSSGT